MARAGLLPAVREGGAWPFKCYSLTAFTNEEEQGVGLADKMPFLLETGFASWAARLPGRQAVDSPTSSSLATWSPGRTRPLPAGVAEGGDSPGWNVPVPH